MSTIERKILTTGDFARADRAGLSAQSSAQPTAELKAVPNPLYNYSSYTYNFTLAAVRRSAANNPAAYMEKKLDLVILKTGGKGTDGLSLDVEAVDRIVSTKINTESGDRYTPVDPIVKDFSGAEQVGIFNKDSPGRFDMFIDNVEIDTIMAPSEATGASLANSIKFDVIEPYSINGFLEALHFSAVAAGYLNYMQASYVLKLEFKGYPAGVTTPSAEVIPNSTRYFLLGFAGLDVEVTERGTRYRCKTVPFNEKVLGLTNTIKTPISMKGKTVKEILNNLCDNLNDQLVNSDKKAKEENRVANRSDKYFIKFPTRNEDGTLDYNKDNKIANTALSDIAQSNGDTLYSFTKPGNNSKSSAYRIVGETTQGKENVESSLMQVQYRENAKIHEIISSVIRDSEYLRKTLKNINSAIDGYGYFDFFIIKTEVENQQETDTVSRKPFQNFTYVVLPYKVHYTRIPGYATQRFDPNKFKNIILKEYNYIYTGKNNDVINFKLNFNSLFFEAYPRAMGNNDQPDARFSDSKDQKNDPIIKSDSSGAIASVIVGTPMHRVSDLPTSIQQPGGNASQPSVDPYQAVARNMYNAIINSQVSLTNGEIEIIGDPFYLIQGGIGNFNPVQSEKSNRINDKGDANHLFGEVLIQIKFRNPVGIQSLEEGGMAAFDKNDAPFAGIYRVNTVKNIFSDGIFKQRLNIIRLLGQTTDKLEPTKPEEKFTTRTSSGGSVAPGDDSTAVFDRQDAEIGAAMTEAQRLAMIEEVIAAETQAVAIQEAQAAAQAAEAAQEAIKQASPFVQDGMLSNPGVSEEAAAQFVSSPKLLETSEPQFSPNTPVIENGEVVGYLQPIVTPVYENGILSGYKHSANLSRPISSVPTAIESSVSPSPPVSTAERYERMKEFPTTFSGDEAIQEFNAAFKGLGQRAGQSAAEYDAETRRYYDRYVKWAAGRQTFIQDDRAFANFGKEYNIANPNFSLPPVISGERRQVSGNFVYRFDSRGQDLGTWVYPTDIDALKAVEEARKLK